MNRVVHFEIHAEQPARAAEFYKKVFGWKIDKWGESDYYMVVTGEEKPENPSKYPGINGGMMVRKGAAPVEGAAVNAYVCSMLVEDIDKAIADVVEAGGTLAVAKYAYPGMAWQAYYKDTEGNIFGLHMADVNAK